MSAVAAGLVQDDARLPRAVFADLGLSEPLLQAIAEMGYATRPRSRSRRSPSC